MDFNLPKAISNGGVFAIKGASVSMTLTGIKFTTPRAQSGSGGIFHIDNTGSTTLTMTRCTITDPGANINGGVG